MAITASPAFRSAFSCARSRAFFFSSSAFLLVGGLSAQTADLSCLKEPFAWGARPALDAALPPLSAIEGADVLSDSLRIAFRRAKPEFITVFFERHQVIRFGDADAVRKHSTFTLPESLDPPFDRQDLPFAKKDSLPRPLYFNAQVVFCRARKLGRGPDAGALPVDGRVVRQRVKQGDRFREAWSYALEVIGVLPGDTIEVHWKYSVPFLENWMKFNAQRVFFHGALYKHASHLTIEADGMQGFRHWGIPPDSVEEDGRTTRKFWNAKNLPAIADEVNARWYAELPFLTIGTLQDAQFYSHTTSSGIAVDIPYWAKAMRLRESNAHWWRQVALKNIPDAQTERMKDFIDLYPGTDPIDRLKRMHTAIATTFDYRLDDAWYDNKDRGNQRMGDQLRDKRLREISRYDLYSKLISMLRLKYYTAYVMDRRVGALNLDWLSQIWNNEWTFLLNANGTPVHLYPKRTRFGLLPNEMPFYWEGTQALVGDVDKLWADGELGAKAAMVPEFVPLRAQPLQANSRISSLDIEVDMAKGDLTVHATVLLSGQWSTMTRSAYLFGAVDSSIHPGYGHRLQDVPGAIVQHENFGEVGPEPQYRTTIELAFTLPGRVKAEIGNSWTIDLRDLVHHVVDTGFVAQGRDLSYWFDFAGSDEVKARLRFNLPVKLVEKPDVKAEELPADYYLYAGQPEPQVVEFTSAWWINSLRVEAGKAPQVAALLKTVAHPPAVLRIELALPDDVPSVFPER